MEQPEQPKEKKEDTYIGPSVSDLEVVENIDSDADRDLVKKNLGLYQQLDQLPNTKARELVSMHDGDEWEKVNELFQINRREKARYKLYKTDHD